MCRWQQNFSHLPGTNKMSGWAENLTDVLVIGGGMAGLCAALSAREAGATVTMLEASPQHMRGGNMRHARNIRLPHDTATGMSPATYTVEEFSADLARVSGGHGDKDLIGITAGRAIDLGDWLVKHGVVFQTGDIPFSRRTAFFLGGGKTALNVLYGAARNMGVKIRYETALETLDIDHLPARATILCCGGGQARLVPDVINRGTPFNTGVLTETLLRSGAACRGKQDEAHLVAVDARSPLHDGGIVTRMDGIWNGMAINHLGGRFMDETVISGSRRYALWGQAVAALPHRRATLIVDAVGIRGVPRMAFAPIMAETLDGMADLIRADAGLLKRSAEESARVRVPPYYAFPIRAGVTFACHGLQVDARSRVMMCDGSTRDDLFAAGTIMSAGILHAGYLSGTALTISAVFGRLAGREAARHALA